ncbi:nucleoside phosphorylase domain-containing protein [Phaeosphaeriaceae sp. PMI808]|nr:nucleoside phosphorylase domain-containing protein [Phaeosphaeriaceae sp. PMI808]
MGEDELPDDVRYGGRFILGAMGHHYVVLVWISGMGKIEAAHAAATLWQSFPSISLVLVVGRCGGTPRDETNNEEIHLGDVVISKGITSFDSGKIRGDGYRQEMAMLPDTQLNTFLAKLEHSKRSRKRLAELSQHWLRFASREKESLLLQSEGRPEPKLHFGYIISGDMVIKSAKHRDELQQSNKYKPIAFDMESFAIAQAYPGKVLAIKGFCDYADGGGDKSWGDYASFTSAAYMRALLDSWEPEPSSSRTSETSPRTVFTRRPNRETLQDPDEPQESVSEVTEPQPNPFFSTFERSVDQEPGPSSTHGPNKSLDADQEEVHQGPESSSSRTPRFINTLQESGRGLRNLFRRDKS